MSIGGPRCWRSEFHIMSEWSDCQTGNKLKENAQNAQIESSSISFPHSSRQWIFLRPKLGRECVGDVSKWHGTSV
jgi:hypothetical protein